MIDREFLFAIERGQLEKVQKMLEDPDLNPNLPHHPAIGKACIEPYPAIVKLLLADPRVDPAAFYDEALRMNSNCRGNLDDHLEVFKLLLADPRVDPAAMDNKVLGGVCNYGDAAIAKILLEDPRITNPEGRIFGAAHAGNAEVVLEFIRCGKVSDVE